MRIRDHYSPNFDARNGQAIDMLVMHYTDMQSCDEAVERLCDEAAQVSAHYVVDETGEVLVLVREENRAWHAGESHWRGSNNINARSIGIEICNPGHSHGYHAFPPRQMKAVTQLAQEIIERHGIPARNVVGHSDIAFLRKVDPGELFDWRGCARNGVGLFPFEARALPGPELARGDSGTPVMRLQTALANWGYGLKLDGDYGEKTQRCIEAFQRHYRPSNLDGVWDNECAGLLAALHGMV